MPQLGTTWHRSLRFLPSRRQGLRGNSQAALLAALVELLREAGVGNLGSLSSFRIPLELASSPAPEGAPTVLLYGQDVVRPATISGTRRRLRRPSATARSRAGRVRHQGERPRPRRRAPRLQRPTSGGDQSRHRGPWKRSASPLDTNSRPQAGPLHCRCDGDLGHGQCPARCADTDVALADGDRDCRVRRSAGPSTVELAARPRMR